MKTVSTLLLLVFHCSIIFAQTVYVSAENGLNVREDATLSAPKKGKFYYGDQLTILARNYTKVVVMEGDKRIEGDWIRISGINEKEKLLEGYVFDGYTTEQVISKPKTIVFKEFSIKLPPIEFWNEGDNFNKTLDDKAYLMVGLGSDLGGDLFKIKNNSLKNMEVFQFYENSITIMNEGPHCDLINWKNYASPWENVPYYAKTNTFRSLNYTDQDREKFIQINMDTLRSIVSRDCGVQWAKLIENIKSPTEYPSGVGMSRIYIKIIGTNENGAKIEKLLTFEFPMGC